MLNNQEMSRTTAWNPETYARDARFVADLGQPLLELLAPKNGEIIMDLGCGDGALTENSPGELRSLVPMPVSRRRARPGTEAYPSWLPMGITSASNRNSTPF